MKMTKEQLKQQHKDDKARFSKIKGVAVISARHLNYFYKNQKRAGFYIQKKIYNWRITNRTHNLKLAKPGNIAKVMDANGKQENRVIVTGVKDITGFIAKKMAQKLEFVITFHNQTFKNGKIVDN